VRPPAWTLAAGATGLLSSALFSSVLQLDRPRFVFAHTVVVLGFTILYCRSARIVLRDQVRRRWLSGIVGGLGFGILLVRGVLRQPASAAPGGGELVAALLWLGLVYGLADALLLSVLPVLGIYASRGSELRRGFTYRLRWGAAAMGGSLFVTALYHFGFAEFRGVGLAQPLIGNAIVTASYLLTGSPLSPTMAHVIMHGAAVMRGPDTTIQLPPHF
jgi:hypothetical protein